MAADAGIIAKAAQLLKEGHLVAFPTETVYGLGADAESEAAVKKLYAAKGRPANHPVIVHLPNYEAISAWCTDVPQEALLLAQAFWPGPLTLVLKRSARAKDFVTAGQDTVAVRVPNHPVALALLKEFGGGLVAPSANRFGRLSPTRAEDVSKEFGKEVALVLDGGPCQVGIESTIVNLSSSTAEILRPGMITAERIASQLGISLAKPGDLAKSAVRVPGDMPNHYAPLTPLQVVTYPQLLSMIGQLDAAKYAILSFHDRPTEASACEWFKASDEPEKYAHSLYTVLRTLDQVGADKILIEAVPTLSAWHGIADRLSRASEK